ncbi:MAG TPA: hypothetical protein VI322_01485 [Candidatus Saccharimonadia bacterium]
MKKEKEYYQMDDEELRAIYDDNLRGYKDWINKEIDLNEGWLEEAEYMSFARGEIHNIIEEQRKRGFKFDEMLLKSYDSQWQKWILEHNDSEFRLEHNREGQPRQHWWEWIDQLASLTEDQRSTL